MDDQHSPHKVKIDEKAFKAGFLDIMTLRPLWMALSDLWVVLSVIWNDFWRRD